MGLFRKKKREQEGAEKPGGEAERFQLLLSGFVGTAALRQMAFGNLVEGFDWALDLERGSLSFGPQEYSIQLLGTESTASNTWLWGHANTGIGNEKLTQVSRELCGSLREAGFAMFQPDEIPMDKLVNGHNLASMAVFLRKKNCYYRCPTEDGAVNAFVLLEGVQDYVFQPARVETILAVIPKLIAQMPLHHPTLMQAVYRGNGVSLLPEQKQDELVGLTREGRWMICRFDKQQRLTHFSIKSEKQA